MEPRDERNRGMITLVTGLAVMVLAVLLFGVTTESGDPDWVNIITACAGFLMTVTGLSLIFRHRRTGPPHSGPHPHAAS